MWYGTLRVCDVVVGGTLRVCDVWLARVAGVQGVLCRVLGVLGCTRSPCVHARQVFKELARGVRTSREGMGHFQPPLTVRHEIEEEEEQAHLASMASVAHVWQVRQVWRHHIQEEQQQAIMAFVASVACVACVAGVAGMMCMTGMTGPGKYGQV